MWKVRELADKVTNVVMNYTDIESKVREATNDEPWGPTGTIKHELSQATYSYDQFPEVMGMLWKRIAENKRSPRRVYKSLLLLHHLLLHGSDRVVRAAQDRLYEIRSLQDYHVVYDPGFNLDAIIPPSGTETKDGELNVRVKAKEIVDLVQDEEKLRDDRKKARKNRDKYVGIGSDRMMTSKWTDNDYSGGYDDAEQYGRKSRSPSPPSKPKFKPYCDSDTALKGNTDPNCFSTNRNINSLRTKPAPPSPGIEISDDFDPRATEKFADFGDFTSAAAKSPPVSTTAIIAAASSAKEAGGDFADFQSAFADTSSSNNSKSEPQSDSSGKAEDLLGLSFDIGGNVASQPQPSTNNASFLPPNLFSNPAQQPASVSTFPVANNSLGGFPAFGSTVSPPVQSPVGQFPSGFPVSSGSGFPPVQPQSLPVSQLPPVMSFDSTNDIFAPILQPARSPSATNGSVANSSNNNNNNPKPTLQGTTWSDLNISIDDLNLGRSNSKNGAAGGKTSMNQLRATNTSNSGFL